VVVGGFLFLKKVPGCLYKPSTSLFPMLATGPQVLITINKE
jgi:hypothetical protein